MGLLTGASAQKVGRRLDPADAPFVVFGVAGVVGVLVALMFLLGYAALDVWSGLIVALVLMIAAVPALRHVAKLEQDPWLFKVMYGGLLTKYVLSMVRFFFIFVVYKGNGDAGVYHEAGITFARRFAEGEPIHPLPVISAFPVESHWIGDIVGVLYIFTGPSAYAGFLFFSTLCFAGQVFMLRGFRAAVPEGDYRRFAWLVLFLPSLLFWPSSIGKEAVMVFCVGLAVYGGGLLLAPTPRIRGIGYFAAGLFGLTFVRPHIALISVAALGVAFAVGSLTGSRGDSGMGAGRSRALRLVALVALVAVASFVGTRFTARFGSEDGSTDAGSTLSGTTAQTAQGGSEFRPVQVTGPQKLPLGLVSVVYRPFPWEASSINALIAAVEGLLLLGITAASWRRVLNFPRLAIRRPFLVFVSVYVLVFAVAFSFIANFGILARQRTQMLPLFLMLLALPVSMPDRAEGGGRRSGNGINHPTDSPLRGARLAPMSDLGLQRRTTEGHTS